MLNNICIFAPMKSAVSYLFSALLICVYMVTTMGFGVHICSTRGTSQVKLLAGEEMCVHDGGHNINHGQKACGCDEHDDDSCCHTLIYILDNAQDVANQIKIDAPKVVLDVALQINFNICTLSDATDTAFYAANVVRGPGGGIDAITPLRL